MKIAAFLIFALLTAAFCCWFAYHDHIEWEWQKMQRENLEPEPEPDLELV
jgi:hypothetical protein